MRTAVKLVTLASLTFAQRLAAYIPTLSPILGYHLNEASGTTAFNYGSLAAADATFSPGVGAVGQIGQIGSREAYSFDAANSILTGPSSATISNLTAFTFAVLLKCATAGESNLGRIIGDNERRTLNIASSASPFRLTLTVTATGNGVATTNAGLGITAGAWMWLFGTYDDGDGVRKPKIFIGRNGAVTEATYSTQTAATGTLTAGTGAITVGNRAALDRTVDGSVDETFLVGRALTTTEMLPIVQMSGL